MASERILILGGTRFIGPAIVHNLRNRGAEVTVFHRGVNRAEIPLSVEERIGDRMNGAALRDLIAEVRPDAIIDTFAMTEETAQITLDALEGWEGQLVMLSSCDVYYNFGAVLGNESGEPSPAPLTEESPLRSRLYPYKADPPRLASDPQAWRDHYDKIPVEKAYLATGAVVLRLPMVFGPGDYQHRMAPYLRPMLDERPFLLLSSELESFVFPRGYIDNVAEAIAVAALSQVKSRIYNVADEHVYTEAAWIVSIALAIKWSGEIHTLPNNQLPEANRSSMNSRYPLEICARRIREELGVREIVSPEAAIRACVEWECENMPTIRMDYAAEDAVVRRHLLL